MCPILRSILSGAVLPCPSAKTPPTIGLGISSPRLLPGNLSHIAIVSSNRSTVVPTRGLVIHNIGGGAREEDTLFAFRQTGHFRFGPI
ncbi:DUF1287 domain-containing protein [Mesorhizobium sp. M0114]|uniref:DUF1287 domain-containing protein n=1 Tax=Mesorhizobium sp. M0114 TaxID=2956882 RepID=UPI00333921DA